MDSWDGYPPIIQQFPNLGNLCLRLLEASWSRASDFKSVYRCGQLEMVWWKVLEDWPEVGLGEDCTLLHDILASRHCGSLKDRDRLAWSPNSKGVFTIASG